MPLDVRGARALAACLCVLAAPAVAQRARAGWRPENLERLDRLIRTFGKGGPGYDAQRKPVAVFDLDDTVVKNDIGDASLYWMVSNGKLRKPRDWAALNPSLTPEAVRELQARCGALPDPLPTHLDAPCADAILSIYEDGATTSGAPAFLEAGDPDVYRTSYAFYAQLFAGYTPAQVKAFTGKALAQNLSNPQGAVQKIGTRTYKAWVRVYPEMKDLIRRLRKEGFDVWVLSASIQPSVEAAARRVGIGPERVIGVRQVLDGEGRLTDAFEGCGPYPDGNKAILTYRRGKRCWLNKIAFGEDDPARQMETPSPTVFAAGDAETDFFFLQDARELRLVIDRGKPELLCHALANADGKWLINPMFIEPRAAKGSTLSCAAYGLSDQKDPAAAPEEPEQ